jgi:hypothetical protein
MQRAEKAGNFTASGFRCLCTTGANDNGRAAKAPSDDIASSTVRADAACETPPVRHGMQCASCPLAHSAMQHSRVPEKQALPYVCAPAEQALCGEGISSASPAMSPGVSGSATVTTWLSMVRIPCFMDATGLVSSKCQRSQPARPSCGTWSLRLLFGNPLNM